MAVAQKDLLAIACRRIRDLDRPACIKNSELRYIAVNRAYADFFGIDIGEFAGRKSRDLSAPDESSEREVMEWRTLVYGVEGTITCPDPVTGMGHAMLVERFLADNDAAFVFCMFLAAPSPRLDAQTDGPDAAIIVDRGSALEPITEIRDARVLAVSADARERRILTELLCRWAPDGCVVESEAIALAVLDAAPDLGVAVDCLVIGECGDAARLIASVRQDRRFETLPIISMGGCERGGGSPEPLRLGRPAQADVLRAALVNALRARAAVDAPVKAERHLDVLVAEDNEVHQIVFRRILEDTGLNFVIVADGAEVVDVWERRRPRMILMDILLPAISGFQAARRIRERERQAGGDSHVPIVGMTSYPPEVDRSLCLDAGMDDQLAKPISPDALKTKIGLWLKPASGPILATSKTR